MLLPTSADLFLTQSVLIGSTDGNALSGPGSGSKRWRRNRDHRVAMPGTRAAAQSRVINFGTIQGVYAFEAGGAAYIGVDVIRNRGMMVGGLDLGGASNINTVSFQSGGAVRMSLTNTVATPEAANGDSYVNIQNVIGSRFGSDGIYGGGAGNDLNGMGGADIVAGYAGDDRLTGGIGADNMTGGQGNDVFIFNALAEAGDTNTDFRGAVGDNDTFWISATGFGGGLALGLLPLTQLTDQASKVAHAATDRFMMSTVWVGPLVFWWPACRQAPPIWGSWTSL